MSDTLERIIARETAFPVHEGSFLHEAFVPVATEIDLIMQAYLPAVLDSMMPDTAAGDDLDRAAALYGVGRKSASTARGAVVFTGRPGATVAQNIPVSNDMGRIYLTDHSAVIPAEGSVSVPVTAAEPGAAYNTASGTVTTMPSALVGIESCSNPEAILGGVDRESDAALRDRLFARIRLQSASGCVNDYIRWACEVPGISAAACLPIWKGAGTVKVIVAGDGHGPVGAALLQQVADHIESVRPIGAAVTVVSVHVLIVNVTARLVLDAGFTADAVKADVVAALQAAVQENGFGAAYLSIAKLGAALLAVRGVQDYEALQLNGHTTNIPLTTEQVPMLGTVTLS